MCAFIDSRACLKRRSIRSFVILERAPTRAFSLLTYRGLGYVKHSVLNVKAIVGAFNQEKA